MKHEANKPEYEDFEYECSFCERLWQVGYPTILAAGLIGNALCLLAFAMHKLRRETQLLCSLCAALDSLALVTAFVSRWPDAAFGIYIHGHPALCHVLFTANYLLPELAAWTFVYLSIDRFLSVYNLLRYCWLVRSRHICLLITCFMGLVLLLVNIHFLFFRETNTSVFQTSATKPNLFLSSEAHLLKNNSIQEHEIMEIKEVLLHSNLPLSSSHILINLTNARVSSLNHSDILKRGNESMLYAIKSESSNCKAAIAGSQWTFWNLVDHVLSSLGPFAIIFALNLAIIIRISARTRPVNARQGFIVSTKNQVAATSDSNAERSVTLMLLVTTFAFVVMRSPIAVGHSLQMLLTEEKLFALIEPVTCMAAFAVAEMLAFGHHAIQFYVYFACSARFRQTLHRQLDLFVHRFELLLFRLAIRTPNFETAKEIPLAPYRQPNLQYHCVSPISRPQRFDCCHHAFMWIGQHVLMCRCCLKKRVVHHPSCLYFRDEQRFECECLDASIERPAHIVVHLGDRQIPFVNIGI